MAWNAARANGTAAVLAVWLVAVAGCGGGSFVPAPPAELNALTDASSGQKTQSLALILSNERGDDGRFWEDGARQEAGLVRMAFSAERPAPDDPPAKQAGLIRGAVERGASALLVDAADGPEVAQALNDARARGTTVVVLGRRVPDRDPSAPLARVAFVPFDGPGRTLVDAMLADIKAAGLPADGHALVAVKTGASRDAREAADGLAGALKSAGFTAAEVVTIEADDRPATLIKAARDLEARVEADPKLTAVAGVGEAEIGVALHARHELKQKGKPLISVGGCLTVVQTLDVALLNACSGLLNRSQPALARQGVRLAADLTRGRTADVVRTVRMPFVPRGDIGDPAMFPLHVKEPGGDPDKK